MTKSWVALSSPRGSSVAAGTALYMRVYDGETGALKHTLQLDDGLAQESALREPDPFLSYGLPTLSPPAINSLAGTHSHFDHIGAWLKHLHQLSQGKERAPVFLSPEEYAVLPVLLADGLSISLAKEQIYEREYQKQLAFLGAVFPGFDQKKGIVLPGAKKEGPVNFIILNDGETAAFGPSGDFSATAYRAKGREHLPGTNYYVFDFGGTTVATLLDVGLELSHDPQEDLRNQPWLSKIAGNSALIMEGTTADREDDLGPRAGRERALAEDLLETLGSYDLVVYPAFAQDRSGDLLKLVKATLEGAGLGRDKVEVVFAAPLAEDLMRTRDSPYADCIPLLDGTIKDASWTFSEDAKEGKKYVVIATAGFGDYPTPSYFHLQEALALERGAIRLTSTFAPEFSEVDRMRKLPDLPEGKLRTVSLTGHLPYGRDYDYLASLAAPQEGGATYLVHGDFRALWRMQKNLSDRAGTHRVMKPAYCKPDRGLIVPAAEGDGARTVCIADPYTSLVVGPEGQVRRVRRSEEVLAVGSLIRRHAQ